MKNSKERMIKKVTQRLENAIPNKADELVGKLDLKNMTESQLSAIMFILIKLEVSLLANGKIGSVIKVLGSKTDKSGKRRPMTEISKDIEVNNESRPKRKEVDELFDVLEDDKKKEGLK